MDKPKRKIIQKRQAIYPHRTHAIIQEMLKKTFSFRGEPGLLNRKSNHLQVDETGA